MMQRTILLMVVFAALAIPLAAAEPEVPASPPTQADLEKAIATMRRVDAAAMDEEQTKAKAAELDKAWTTLIAAGKTGAEALKAGIQKIDAAGEKDDYFQLGAAEVLWRIGQLDEAKTIADIWSGGVSFTANYAYVFYTAVDAARTQDSRALPMLRAVLNDKEGEWYTTRHAMDFRWPLTMEFIWGLYGSKGLAALREVLATSNDSVALESAVYLLAKAQCLPALPRIRELAQGGQGDVRRMAIRCLGIFGHPQDYDLLIKGLILKDPEEVWPYVFALYEYEDLRAVPLLVPLLASEDDELRGEVCAGLFHLLTPQAFEALHAFAEVPADASDARKKDAEECSRFIQEVLKAMNLTWEAYAAKPPAEKETLLASFRDRGEQEYVLTKEDRRLTHDQLLEAAANWQKNNRIRIGEADPYVWVEGRHVLAAATPADIDLLIDIKAALYVRLSDECLYETRILDGLIWRIGRSRYRSVVGITPKVELPK